MSGSFGVLVGWVLEEDEDEDAALVFVLVLVVVDPGSLPVMPMIDTILLLMNVVVAETIASTDIDTFAGITLWFNEESSGQAVG